MVDDTRVWVHGCDPGRVSDGSRLALYQALNRVPFFYIFLACVFCYCSFLFVVSVLFRYVFLLFVFEFALVGALYKYVPLIFFCPADHVPDWQPRILLGTVEARSVNVKKTTTTTTGTMYWLLLLLLLFLKEKEWTDCVQSDIRTFGIAGDWKATALNAEVWVETVTEGGRRFMAAWRKEEVDAARHRQEKREATRLGTLLSQTGV